MTRRHQKVRMGPNTTRHISKAQKVMPRPARLPLPRGTFFGPEEDQEATPGPVPKHDSVQMHACPHIASAVLPSNIRTFSEPEIANSLASHSATASNCASDHCRPIANSNQSPCVRAVPADHNKPPTSGKSPSLCSSRLALQKLIISISDSLSGDCDPHQLRLADCDRGGLHVPPNG